MTKKHKITLLVSLLVLLALIIVVVVCICLKNRDDDPINVDESIDAVFLISDNVVITKDQSLSSEFLNGQKGYMFSTNTNNSSVSFKEGLAGDFHVTFTPFSKVVGENDFESLIFKFRSAESKIGFDLEFNPHNDGVVMGLSLTNIPQTRREIYLDGSFCNVSDSAITFSFNPDQMCLYNADGEIVADFQSYEYMKAFNMHSLIENYSRYSVDIVFSGIKSGHTASIIIFDVCGQKFDGIDLNNTAGPIIFNKVYLNSGVKGKPYLINRDFCTFDIKDGFLNFAGKIVITDDSNNLINITDNNFTPSNAGIHYITFTPVDVDGCEGDSYTQQFYVYNEQPEIEFNFDFPVENQKVGVGSMISFGAITANSAIQENLLQVEAKILLNNDVLYTKNDCSNGFSYEFNQTGDYQVVFTAIDAVGYKAEHMVTINVDDSAIFVNAIKDEYVKDFLLDLSSIYAKKGDESYKTDKVIIFPDGRTTNSSVVCLDMVGIYCVNLKSQINGGIVERNIYFKATNNNETLWEKKDGLTITSNYVAPDYADVPYNGTLLTVTRPLEVEYKNVIDISDNNSEDLLIELFVAPVVEGSMETSCIDIVLTDIYDNNNIIDIRLTRDAWLWDSMTDMMSIIAQPKKDFNNEYLKEVCTASNNYQQYYYYRQNIYSSFFGKIDNNNKSSVSQSVKLYFDYGTGELYANFAKKGSELGKIVVADLSDESYVGTGKSWKKFATGEAYLSIKVTELKQTANVMILNVDGQSMSGSETCDVTSPSIFVDYIDNNNVVPYGILNTPYNIFNAYSRDVVDGINKNLKIKVFKVDDNKLLELELKSDTFTPTSIGDYIIRYIAHDNSGNNSIRDVKLQVKDISEIPVINYEFNGQLKEIICVGEKYKFYDGIASGGNGRVSATIKISLGNENIILDEDKSFIVEKAGDYKISVVLSDYTRKSDEFIFDFTAEYSTEPLIEERTMPKAIILGEKFTFPDFSAVSYTPDGKVNEKIEFIVNGQKLENNYYIPDKVGVLDVQVKSGGTILEYDIAVVSSEIGEQYVSRYFYTNATTKVIERSITFTFSEPTFVNVVKPINTQFAYFTVSSENAIGNIGGVPVSYKPGENLSRIDFTFTDKLYQNISFTASLIKKDSLESYLEYNGKRYIITDAVFDTYAKNFNVEFNNETNMILVGEKEICKVDFCDNGDYFYGFMSEEVYLDFVMPEVENSGIAAIGIVNIAGQNFDVSKTSGRSRPIIKILGEFYTVEINEEITIPAACAFDFMQEITSVRVSVVSPTGKELLNNADASTPITLKAEEYGSYRIVYDAINSSKFSTKNNFVINVLDRIPPTINLLTEIPEVVTQNSTVELPQMTVSDNNFAEEDITKYIYIIAPNAQSFTLTETSFVPEQKGTYTIIYYAVDKDNAIATIIRYLYVV